jgi:hypothetical protein
MGERRSQLRLIHDGLLATILDRLQAVSHQ